jgi:hypothetical protein
MISKGENKMLKKYYMTREYFKLRNGSPEFYASDEVVIESYGSKKHVIKHLKSLVSVSKFTSSLGVAMKDLKGVETKEAYTIVCSDDDEVVGYLYE